VIFFLTVVPETKDRSLEEIQTNLGANLKRAARARRRRPRPVRA
jgi:hypothetical protein